jgi:hypothetical protein
VDQNVCASQGNEVIAMRTKAGAPICVILPVGRAMTPLGLLETHSRKRRDTILPSTVTFATCVEIDTQKFPDQTFVEAPKSRVLDYRQEDTASWEGANL